MFRFFKKKKGQSDVAIEVAVGLLQAQLSLENTEDNHAVNEKLTDYYSRGYIFGLCDALLQSAGVKNDVEAMALLTVAHIKLFGNENGANIVGQSFRDQDNSTFAKGRMRGGQDLIEFLKNKTPPMGLTGYLLSGETHLKEPSKINGGNSAQKSVPYTQSQSRIVVLLVDDQMMVAEGIRRMLSDAQDIEIHHCDNSHQAVDAALEVGSTVLLLDTVMPEGDSIDQIRAFRNHPALKSVAIIILSSVSNPHAVSEALELGANDYLIKPPDKIELIARIRAHHRTYLLLHKSHVAYQVD